MYLLHAHGHMPETRTVSYYMNRELYDQTVRRSSKEVADWTNAIWEHFFPFYYLFHTVSFFRMHVYVCLEVGYAGNTRGHTIHT